MAFYVRYFDAETILPQKEDILPYITSLNMMNPRELDLVASSIGKLKNGTNRIFLDGSKKRYILAIATDKSDISEFQKNTKKEARPAAKPKEETVRSVPAVDPEMQNAGWKLYSLDYNQKEEAAMLPFTFRAKIKDVNLMQAYEMMASYLKEKYGERCDIPAFAPELLQMAPVEE